MSAVLDPSTATLPQAGALEIATPRDGAVMPGFNSKANWELAQRVARAFASSTLVPELYRGEQGIANCLIALEMANRMGASPLLVMQNLYVVHGNPSWSAKFLIATFNQNGRFSALRYSWNKDRSSCFAYAVEKSTGETLEGPTVTTEMAKAEGWSTKNGSKWKTMPELMLMYRAATFFVRTYAPELSMGLQTVDEVEDVYETAPSAGLSAVRAALDVDKSTGEIKQPGSGVSAFDASAAAIRSAGDGETAALVLDAARDECTATELEQLAEIYRTAWPQ